MSAVANPKAILRSVGQRSRSLRLTLGRRQTDVAAAAGIPVATLRRFEGGVNVGFHAVAQIALALGAEREVANLFAPRDLRSLDDILAEGRTPVRARPKR